MFELIILSICKIILDLIHDAIKKIYGLVLVISSNPILWQKYFMQSETISVSESVLPEQFQFLMSSKMARRQIAISLSNILLPTMLA
jgi:hypothetical protein